MKHTKGPWDVTALDRKGNYKIKTDLISTDEALANAKLVAAAPEMLEALMQIDFAMASGRYYEIDTAKFRAAIQKAKGEI